MTKEYLKDNVRDFFDCYYAKGDTPEEMYEFFIDCTKSYIRELREWNQGNWTENDYQRALEEELNSITLNDCVDACEVYGILEEDGE